MGYGLENLESVVGLGLACGLVLQLGLVSGLYKWLFYLATVRQLNHVVFNIYSKADSRAFGVRDVICIVTHKSALKIRAHGR